jgi:probable rRNA maturation factor
MDAASQKRPFHVDLQVATNDDQLPAGAEWSLWADTAFDVAATANGIARRLTVRLVGNDEGRRLNKAYRHKDAPTNVLAFPGSDRNELLDPDERELGDLVICLPIAHREAKQQGKPPLAHVAHLVVHGTLHLLGYDHEEAAAAGKMEELETRIMRRLGFPDPYSEP